MDRRYFLGTIGGAVTAATFGIGRLDAQERAVFGGSGFAEAIRAIEARTGGRVGVAVLDTATGRRFGHRGDERFAMCSTFKFILSAAVLHAADARRLRMDRAVPVTRRDIVSHSPITEKHVGRTMTVAALCHATITTSDNGAANLLLGLVGGPAGVTRFVRTLGDRVTRLDRMEPMMNDVGDDDPRDTTSPTAMLGTMHALLFGRTLTPAARRTLTGWMIANTTGDTRLRAGLPKGWRVGDKTGTADRGKNNDIGVFWPVGGGAPILVTSYLSGSNADPARLNAAHADVARAIVAARGGRGAWWSDMPWAAIPA